MSNPKSHDPLTEWNRLNKENAEQGYVSSLFQSMAETTTVVDKYSLWLIAGTGATGALLITQIQSVLPYLSQLGFKVCMVLLVLSALFGFIAKYYSLRCEIQIKTQSKLMELVKPILDKYEQDGNTIKKYAAQKGVELQSEIDFAVIINEFSRPFPWWIKWLIGRKVQQSTGDRQAGFHVAIKAYKSQLQWTFFQTCLFLAFMLTGAWFASAK